MEEIKVDWSLYKGNNSKVGKEAYIDLMIKLEEIKGVLLTEYKTNDQKVDIRFDDAILKIEPNEFKKRVYKWVNRFKKEVNINGDKFIKFTRVSEGNRLIALIKTYDGSNVEVAMTTYHIFVNTRKEFYNSLSEVNGTAMGGFEGNFEKINLKIDDAIINITPSSFTLQTYKSILKFKQNIRNNGDEFLRFTNYIEKNGIVAAIKTFDGAIIERDSGNYNDLTKSRKEIYKLVEELDGSLVVPFKGINEEITIKFDDVLITSLADSYKRQIHNKIIKFKQKINNNNDKFIKFTDYIEENGIRALIKTVDNGMIERSVGTYNGFIRNRKNFNTILEKVNGSLLSPFLGSEKNVKIKVDNAIIEMTPTNFKTNTYPSIINFKKQLDKNREKFIEISKCSDSSKQLLYSLIETYDGGKVEVAISSYRQFVRGRKSFYKYIEKKKYYHLSPYIGNEEKILIDFGCGHKNHWTKPIRVKSGLGCPVCNQSKGELQIASILDKNNIKYFRQCKFDGLKHKDYLKVDFYIPDINLIIEYDGIQHFEPVDFGEKDKGKIHQKFEKTKYRDNLKNEYCNIRNINILRIPYWIKLKDIEKSVMNKVNELIEVGIEYDSIIEDEGIWKVI